MARRPDTRRMKKLRAAFFAEGKRLDADPATRHLANCWLCGHRIDYLAEPSSTPDSHNLDHFKPYADAPELIDDPSNFRHACFVCNTSRGRRAPSPGLGDPLGDWW